MEEDAPLSVPMDAPRVQQVQLLAGGLLVNLLMEEVAVAQQKGAKTLMQPTLV